MPRSTEELSSAAHGMTETLGEVENLAGQLGAQATELAEEAAGHGWHGISTRMQEVAEALDATASEVGTSKHACEKASEAVGLINDKIPAEDVVAHLTTSTSQLSEAVSALERAVEKAEEAKEAANEIGQQGMMQATVDLHDQLTEVHEQLAEQQGTSENERAAAKAYAGKQLRILTQGGGTEATAQPGATLQTPVADKSLETPWAPPDPDYSSTSTPSPARETAPLPQRQSADSARAPGCVFLRGRLFRGVSVMR